MAMKKTPGGMTPGSRNVSAGAMKAGLKKMDEAKARAASRSDAAKPIKGGAKNTPSSLDKAIADYRRLFSAAAKTGKAGGMTRDQIAQRLDELMWQRRRQQQ